MPKCLDCRESELELIIEGKIWVQLAEPYYKCQKCKTEFDVEDVEEQDA